MKLVQFIPNQRVAVASLSKSGILSLPKRLNLFGEANKVIILTDEDEKSNKSERKFYIQEAEEDAIDSYTLATSNSTQRINTISLLKNEFPNFKEGEVLISFREEDGKTYIVITVGANSPDE